MTTFAEQAKDVREIARSKMVSHANPPAGGSAFPFVPPSWAPHW